MMITPFLTRINSLSTFKTSRIFLVHRTASARDLRRIWRAPLARCAPVYFKYSSCEGTPSLWANRERRGRGRLECCGWEKMNNVALLNWCCNGCYPYALSMCRNRHRGISIWTLWFGCDWTGFAESTIERLLKFRVRYCHTEYNNDATLFLCIALFA